MEVYGGGQMPALLDRPASPAPAMLFTEITSSSRPPRAAVLPPFPSSLLRRRRRRCTLIDVRDDEGLRGQERPARSARDEALLHCTNQFNLPARGR
jgi:hypothetical protein